MQKTWRKKWQNLAWFALAAVTVVLLMSAVSKKNHKACRGAEVTFSTDGNNFFIEEKGIIALLKANGLVIGQSLETINLKDLEKALKKDKWIANAQLFFDNNQVLQIKVEEKTPVARIFTVEGNSFYIDSSCRQLPLSEKLSVRIPMFTSFPSDRTELSKPDSALLASVKDLALFIQADSFWNAQVAQIDITPDGFEMVPTLGNHIVLLGEKDDWQRKFDRLFSFYKEVWTKVGFEKYEKVDVRFSSQVVATRRGAKHAIVDSQKVNTAYEKLVTEEKKSGDDSLFVPVANATEANVKKLPGKAEVISKTESKRILAVKENIKQDKLKTKEVKTALDKQAAEKPVPKAVTKSKKS